MIQEQFTFTDEDRQRVHTRMEETLECLRQRSMTTTELHAVGPRPAAYVRQLRQRGYDIVTEKEGSIARYTLMGFEPQVEVTEEMQAGYYWTSHWRSKRLERLEFDCHKCCNCQSRQSLQVHHWHYDLFDEDLMDLLTLCESCHDRIHEYENVQIHFPNFVTPETAQRLIKSERRTA